MTRSRGRRTPVRRPAPSAGLLITTFSQTIGANLLTNGGFSAWTGDNPDGWAVTGESGSDPAVTQVAPNGSPGTGAARLLSTATWNVPNIQQAVLQSNALYEWELTVGARSGGQITVWGDAINGGNILSTGTRTNLMRSSGSLFRISATTNPPNDFTIDGVAARLITPNPLWIGLANGTHTLTFSLPASPIAGARIEMRYRAADLLLNHWMIALVRSSTNTAWDLLVNSVSGGTVTNRINVSNVGTPDAIRVITTGTTHTAFTGVNGVFTQRGAAVNVSHLDAQAGITAVYGTGFAPSLLTSV